MVEKASFTVNIAGRDVVIKEGTTKDRIRLALGVTEAVLNNIWKGVDKNEEGCTMNMLDKCEFSTFKANITNKTINGNLDVTVTGIEDEISQGLLSQIKEENGKFSINYCIAVSTDEVAKPKTSKLKLTANTKEALVSKLSQLEKLKSAYSKLMFIDSNGWAQPVEDISEEDLEAFFSVSKELLASGDEDLQTAVAFTYTARVGIDNQEVFDKILATKNPIAVNRLAGSLYYESSLSLDNAKKMYSLCKDKEFIANCNKHPDKNAKNVPNGIVKCIMYELKNTVKNSSDLRKQIYKEASQDVRAKIYTYFDYADVMDIINHSDEYSLTNQDILSFATSIAFKGQDGKKDFDTVLSKLPKLANKEAAYHIFRKVAGDIRKHYHVVESGESLRGIIARYVLKNNICKDINDKKDWNDKRKMEAAMEYARDFEKEISEKIGVTQENLKAGQVIDFSKVDSWPQPNWFNWKIFY